MAFDSGEQGLAQRYYIQALRLAAVGNDHALGAHILTDMAMQAHYLGNSQEACSLARAGQRTAARSGSCLTLARCCAVEARAHARAGDTRRCAEAMLRAERALDRGHEEEEPFWVRFFTIQQLHAEFAYAAADLGQTREVHRFASAARTTADGMERRYVLVTTALAAAYLPRGEADRPASADVSWACVLLGETVPLVRVLNTKRGVEAVNGVRQRLQPYAYRTEVQELEAALTAMIGAAA